MEGDVKKLTAYCGLYCGDCFRYRSRVSDLARDLLNELRERRFDKYAEYKSGPAKQFDPVKQFEHFPDCCEVLEAIVSLQCNIPCREGRGCSAFNCDILECCLSRGYQGCWECNEFVSCDRFEKLKVCHGDSPQQNLKTIKELGPENWAEHRHPPYIWL